MGDTYSTEGPVCPYCNYQLTADEPHHFNDMEYTEDNCPSCGKTFRVEVYHSVSWSCEPLTQPPTGSSDLGGA